MPELKRAMKRLDLSFLTVEFRQEPEFLKELFETVALFRPDFILTINHAGLDEEGQVLEWLRKCGVPLASWFVDKHDMFLRRKVDPNALLGVFTWDPDGVEAIRCQGTPSVEYLPLATDPEIFFPSPDDCGHRYDVAFVGSSWNGKIADNIQAGRYPDFLLESYRSLASLLETSPHLSPVALIARNAAQLLVRLEQEDPRTQGMFIRLLQLEATRLRRLRCVECLLPYAPAIVGDIAWKDSLIRHELPFSWYERIHYEKDLSSFFQQVAVNFNTTSLQSGNANNQRVFDVPSCGGFLLTDRTASLEDLFEPDVEVACYETVEDIAGQVEQWLEDESGRNAIVQAARKRVLAEHTYEHRLLRLMQTMHAAFA